MKNKKSSLPIEFTAPSIEGCKLSVNSETVIRQAENNEHHDVKSASDLHHQLWLIYSQLKDAECNPEKRLELLECSRQELGVVLNEMNRLFDSNRNSIRSSLDSTQLFSPQSDPKSPRYQAANLNCRNRKFNLTPDKS